MVGITVSVSVVGIRVGVVSMVGITVGGVAIAIRSLGISRSLVVAVVGITVSVVGIIRIGMISMVSIAVSMMGIGGITIAMVSITIGWVAIAIRDSMIASISISFGLSCDSCEQAEGNNSNGFHFYWRL